MQREFSATPKRKQCEASAKEKKLLKVLGLVVVYMGGTLVNCAPHEVQMKDMIPLLYARGKIFISNTGRFMYGTTFPKISK